MRHAVFTHVIKVKLHFNSPCSVLALTDGRTLHWSQELRYLGIFIKAGQYFRCNYSTCKLKFIRSANCLFAKLAHHASEEVMLPLMVSKCLPALLYLKLVQFYRLMYNL